MGKVLDVVGVFHEPMSNRYNVWVGLCVRDGGRKPIQICAFVACTVRIPFRTVIGPVRACWRVSSSLIGWMSWKNDLMCVIALNNNFN